jgi:membrane protein
VLFAVGWVILTLGFGFYVSHFGNYNVTYGSLGGVIVLETWLYLSSLILLFGAEFNSEVEHQTARDTTAEPGERPLGDRGAWSADHVAEEPADEGKEGDRGQEEPLSDEPSAREPASTVPDRTRSIPREREHPYVTARATNRAAGFAGLQRVGMISAAMSTIGLSLLRKRGREGAGAALLATAAGISLLKRKN